MAISKKVGIVAGLWRYPVKSMLGEQLRIAQRRRLTGRATDHDAVGTILRVKLEQPCPGFEIDGAIGAHGGDDGNQAAGKHVLGSMPCGVSA